MCWPRRSSECVVVLAVLISGCQPFKYEKNLQVWAGTIQNVGIIEAPKRDQHVTITFHSSTAPVSVYLVLEKDNLTVTDRLNANKKPDPSMVLASQEKAEEGTLEGKVPAGNEYTILVAGGMKTTDVSVKITGS